MAKKRNGNMRVSKVSLDAIHVNKTYAGSLEGPPPKSFIIDRAKRHLAEMWGPDRPVHVIFPNNDPRSYRLPAYQYSAWFSSWTPVKDEDAMGSHLFLIWWDDKFNTDNLEEFAAAHWGHAKDFNL